MIDLVLKFFLVSSFLLIFYQDYKDRLVYWFLYPVVGILAYLIQSSTIGYLPAFINSVVNLVFIAIVLLVAYGYAKTVMKKGLIDQSIGLGDILLFIFLCFTFSPVAFLILFVFALLFSLLLHLLLKKQHEVNIPLAGYVAVFFSGIYILSFFIAPKYLFA